MRERLLLGYQLIAGVSDASTGVLLIVSPRFAMHMRSLTVPLDATPFLSFIGSFVFAVGLTYLYGAVLVRRSREVRRLQTVWLVTAIIRASVATFVVTAILTGSLVSGWLTIAIFDGLCALIQVYGLRQGWFA